MTSRAALRWREGIAAEPAHDAFIEAVFGMAPPGRAEAPRWRAAGFFEPGGRCVAAAEVAGLTLLADGAPHGVAALRLVGVVADRRGEGLFRRLMEAVLRGVGGVTVLLYAAEPALYERFGFVPVSQLCFIGPAPAAAAAPPARPLDPAGDAALIRQLLLEREPLSDAAAIVGAPGLFLDRIAADDEPLLLAHLPGADALLAYGEDGNTLVVADVVAAAMPSLAAILGALPRPYRRIRALFPPDKLRWRGAPESDETGLMRRGTLPPLPPFRLPPTTEF